jgi:hypothetical protein
MEYLIQQSLKLQGNKIFELQADTFQIAEDLAKRNLSKETEISSELAINIQKLWADPGFNVTFEKYPPPHLSADTVELFLHDIHRIVAKDYIPTDEDMLRAYSRTTGIDKHQVTRRNFKLEFTDVGGSNGIAERRKWAEVIPECTALLYVCAISDYDQQVDESKSSKINSLENSAKLFGKLLEDHPAVAQMPIFILFNKKDEFRRKFAKVPFEKYFPEWEGISAEEAQTFIENYFTTTAKIEKLPTVTHFTNARDTSGMRKVLTEVMDDVERFVVSKRDFSSLTSAISAIPTGPTRAAKPRRSLIMAGKSS